MEDYETRFQNILRGLFQFDAADLDFGIYRILNYKRDQTRKFIDEDIGEIVDQAFARYRDELTDNIGRLFEEARQEVIQQLNPGVFLPTGDLKEEFCNTGVGRKYLEIKARKDEVDAIDEVKLLVFNDLYNFFSRYYDEGDFAPKYRYSIKNHKYAIPYNGEEVKLYWATSDQYYIKTGILFRDYAFFSDATKTYKIIFRTVAAREELSSNKATKARFFVLDDEKPFGLEGNTMVIRLQYRELTSTEVKRYEAAGGSNTAKQGKINRQAMDAVLEGLDNPHLKAALGIYYKNETPLLLYQLSRFTAKNSRDFFIHKNLKNFLSEQLDYFIKAEVISIDTLERERFLDKHITRAKVVREIGERIIDFLAQIQDFQKKLWEKKKFVLKTEYVITTDRIPEGFHQEILKNKKLLEEWKALGFGTSPSKAVLKEKKLPVDTRHFKEDFKERLLEKLTANADLDDLLDGLVIKSENWQGLNLLGENYRERVKCIYIDPPYNTSENTFVYKNNYKHSSWITMMINLLTLSQRMLPRGGVIEVAIDDTETGYLRSIMDALFGESNRVATIAAEVNPAGQNLRPNTPALSHDYCHVYAADIGATDMLLRKLTDEEIETYQEKDSKGSFLWDNLRRRGGNSRPTDRPGQWFPLFITVDTVRVPDMEWDDSDKKWLVKEKPRKGEVEVWPIDPKGEKRIWRVNPDGARRFIKSGDIAVTVKAGRQEVIKKSYMPEGKKPKTLWKDPKYSATTHGTKLLIDILGEQLFSYPKSLYLEMDCLRFWADDDATVLDFFAGSGTTAHAVMNLNNEDGGKRKFILIEMANYFDTVMVPRIKKVAYSFNWKDGKPKDSNGNGVFFKYQVLEQYEDTLDNLELKENRAALNLFGNDYLLKYFLDFESREDATLVNFEHFKKPFSYRLKVNLEEVGEPEEVIVDLPETFHYLLGLKVKKIKVCKDKGRKYLFSMGEKEGRSIAVVWREYDDQWTKADFKKDRDFIVQEIENWAPHVVYVNGQSALTPKIGSQTAEVRPIEPEFRKRMVNAS